MKKVLMIIGGIVVAFAAIIGVIILVVSLTSKKMSCESSVGNITIMYNDDTLTGYGAVGIDYDYDGQKAIADQIGVDEYLDEFEVWFETATNGTCSRK